MCGFLELFSYRYILKKITSYNQLEFLYIVNIFFKFIKNKVLKRVVNFFINVDLGMVIFAFHKVFQVSMFHTVFLSESSSIDISNHWTTLMRSGYHHYLGVSLVKW